MWQSKGDAMLLPVYDNAVLWNRLHIESRQGIHNTQTHRQTQTDTHTHPWRRCSALLPGREEAEGVPSPGCLCTAEPTCCSMCVPGVLRAQWPLRPSPLLPQDTLPHEPPWAAMGGVPVGMEVPLQCPACLASATPVQS